MRKYLLQAGKFQTFRTEAVAHSHILLRRYLRDFVLFVFIDYANTDKLQCVFGMVYIVVCTKLNNTCIGFGYKPRTLMNFLNIKLFYIIAVNEPVPVLLHNIH